MPIGKAALRRAGGDLAIDLLRRLRARLRCASPRRWRATASRPRARPAQPRRRSIATRVLAVARHCSRVLIVHEDSRTGGIGESLAAIIQEEAFESLDAPGPHRRRARHAGAVLAAARGGVPRERAGDYHRRSKSGRVRLRNSGHLATHGCRDPKAWTRPLHPRHPPNRRIPPPRRPERVRIRKWSSTVARCFP